jgi:predicted transcriptional regulator of viral defense system
MPDHSALYHTAEQQAGCFSACQALAAGFTRPLLSYHSRVGRFVRIGNGVYRLAQFPEMPFADLFVAWLQVGNRAVISHESALVVYGLSDILPGEIHVTVPRTASRRRKNLRLHTGRLSPGDVTRRAGLPVTTIGRTIADAIISGLGEEHIQQAIQEALERGLVSEQALLDDACKRGGRVERVVTRLLDQELPG